MVERIGPASPSSPSERKKVPNTKGFIKEVEKVEKTPEADLDQSKKRFFKRHEEEEEEPKATAPSPYESSFYTREKESISEDLPHSPSFYQQADSHKENVSFEKKPEEEAPEPFRKKEEKQKEKTALTPEEKKEKTIFSPFTPSKEKKPDMGKKPLLTKEEMEKKLETLPFKEKKEFEKFPPSSMKKPEKKESLFFPAKEEKKEEKIEKAPRFQPPEKKPPEEKIAPLPKTVSEQREEKLKKKTEEKQKAIEPKKESLPQIKEAVQLLKELPPAVLAEATASASAVAPYVKAESLPLFERMVGTVIQMTSQNLEKCEILLTASAFVGSKYYGTKIVFEKYASAPDSFNIHLTGSDEAVSLFNEHLGGLMQAFQNGNFSFKVGRLWAEYETERPLFKRKPTISEERKEE